MSECGVRSLDTIATHLRALATLIIFNPKYPLEPKAQVIDSREMGVGIINRRLCINKFKFKQSYRQITGPRSFTFCRRDISDCVETDGLLDDSGDGVDTFALFCRIYRSHNPCPCLHGVIRSHDSIILVPATSPSLFLLVDLDLTPPSIRSR